VLLFLGALLTHGLLIYAAADASAADVRGHAALSPRDAGFVAGELMCRSCRVGSFSALARDFADTVAVHRCKAASPRPSFFVPRGFWGLRAPGLIFVRIPHDALLRLSVTITVCWSVQGPDGSDRHARAFGS